MGVFVACALLKLTCLVAVVVDVVVDVVVVDVVVDVAVVDVVVDVVVPVEQLPGV